MPQPIGGVQPFAELARGGATVVYKGYQRSNDRFVLLKTVRPEWGGDADLVRRFEEEARLAAQVCHPNVVSVFDSGRDGATAYLITEFVEGLDLRALVERGALPPPLAAYVLEEAAHGLAAAHAQGILHRDLKPANLLVSEAGAVKLTDFGLASLAPTGAGDGAPVDREVRGTLAYLAPEIVRGDPPSQAADLFSLGALLVEMLTGRPAFARETPSATLDAVLHHDPLPALTADPRVPPALTALAEALLAKDPSRRPSDAAEVVEAVGPIRTRLPAGADDLAAYVHNPASYVPPVPPLWPAPPDVASHASERRAVRSRRRLAWGLATGVLVLVLLGVVGTSLISEQPAEPPAEPLRDPLAIVEDGAAERAPVKLPEAAPAEGEVDVIEPPPAGETGSDAATDEALLPSEPTESEEVDRDALPDAPVRSEEGVDEGEREPSAPPGPSPEVASGALAVVAEPWARVRIGGEVVGTTPFGAIALPAGQHVVTFENPDFPIHTVEVRVEAGEETRLAVSLWELVGRVSLVVSPWAEVTVDGTYWDTVPPQERPLVLAPGTHLLTFTHPTLGTRETTLRIAAGESRTLRVNLNAPSEAPAGAGREGRP